MKFCILSTIATVTLSIFAPLLFWLCVPLVLVYFTFAVGSFFRGEIGKGFALSGFCVALPILSIIGILLTRS